MPDQDQRNRREDFRIDDVMHMRDEPLSVAEFESRKKRIGVRSRMSSTLRNLLAHDVDVEQVMKQAEVPDELVQAIEALDSKLNYLISMNMLNEADRDQLEEREVNVSTTGMSFFTDLPHKVGEPMQITLVIPTFPPQMMELLAEVKWVKPRKSACPQIGVNFFFRSLEEQDSIARYVFKRHREMIRLEEHRA
jgi:PilZ domain